MPDMQAVEVVVQFIHLAASQSFPDNGVTILLLDRCGCSWSRLQSPAGSRRLRGKMARSGMMFTHKRIHRGRRICPRRRPLEMPPQVGTAPRTVYHWPASYNSVGDPAMPKPTTLNRFPLFGLFAHRSRQEAWAIPKTMLDSSATPRPCSTPSSRPRPKRREGREGTRQEEGTAQGDRGQDQDPSIRRAGVPGHLREGQAAEANRRRPRSPRCRRIRFPNQGEVPRRLVRPSRQGVRQVPRGLRSWASGQGRFSISTRHGGTRARSASIASIWKSWRRGLRNGRGRRLLSMASGASERIPKSSRWPRCSSWTFR